MIRSISLVDNLLCISKLAVPVVAGLFVGIVNAGSAAAVSTNKTVPPSVLNDDKADSKVADSVIITGEYINEIVTQFLSVKGVEATPSLNPDRLFRKCDGDLTVNPMFGNFQTVRVECEHATGWRVAVRTKIKTATPDTSISKPKTSVKATIRTSRNIVTKPNKQMETARVVSLTRSMTRGDIITPEDVAFIDVSMREVVGVFFDHDDVVGRRLKTSISARKPVFARQLHPYWMVEKDQEVTLVNRAGAVAVSMLGYALENGQFGEWIKVKNANSDKIVHGQIINSKKIATGANIQ
ncbi:flagellar basal body P-ring formation chaperone FlgA [Candidatus Puniceispirillum marinum]|uniref:SAF domain protein n=1 Tax=Puniceispirillum marinum (strain IMCC1322) TaxID=488538 RepID=D5BS54_PUNMI|nr:flagellar basal body P-ring formation chaperone FlgA [Candidatus Puniceispirillum marinum]ADE39101.1 SAF domain protein [Candidatus Puniceispirillum marinum IMCC1322]